MSNFKIGDKVILKSDVTGEDVEDISIDGDNVDKVKGKILTVEDAFYDGYRDVVSLDGGLGFVWKSCWFRYYSPIPENLFKMEE